METLENGLTKKRWWPFESWPTAIVLFFVVVVGVNLLFIWVGRSTWTGVVTEQAYDKGVAFNRVLDAQKGQDALGWRVALNSAGLRVGAAGRLIVDVRDREGKPLSDARIEGELIRPVTQGMDRAFLMSAVGEGGGGGYQAELTVPLHGWWEVRLRIEANGSQYRYVQRIRLPDGQGGGGRDGLQ
ncbi:MAG: FixH family protein [Magnetococcales bacterium]|nr:FixH family protein [Magnetococcales bacterium]